MRMTLGPRGAWDCDGCGMVILLESEIYSDGSGILRVYHQGHTVMENALPMQIESEVLANRIIMKVNARLKASYEPRFPRCSWDKGLEEW